MKRILVISDVHGDLSLLNKILDLEKEVDLKVFLGDLQNKKYEIIINNFDYYVLGNSDYRIKNIENEIIFMYEDINFFITHGHLYETIWSKIDFKEMIKRVKQKNSDIVLYGHNHKKNIEKIDGIQLFNPGSTSFPRDGMVGSYGIIEVENKKIKNIKHILINF